MTEIMEKRNCRHWRKCGAADGAMNSGCSVSSSLFVSCLAGAASLGAPSARLATAAVSSSLALMLSRNILIFFFGSLHSGFIFPANLSRGFSLSSGASFSFDLSYNLGMTILCLLFRFSPKVTDVMVDVKFM